MGHVYRVRPWVVILENVEALADDTKPNIYHLKESFRQFNYVISYVILQSYGFGLPQDRKRAICDVTNVCTYLLVFVFSI